MRIRAAFLSVAMAAGTPAFGQLHLITGSPTPKYNIGFESALFRVETTGGVTRIADLVPAESGTEWIGMSEDWRKAILLPFENGQWNRVVVVDFDKAAVVKDCRAGGVRYFSSDQWLLDSPAHGRIFGQYSGGFAADGSKQQVVGMILDPAVPCDRTLTTVDKGDIRHFVGTGRAGVSDVDHGSNLHVTVDPDGKVRYRFLGASVYFDYQIPRAMIEDIRQPVSGVEVNNKRLFAVDIREFSEPATGRLLVFRKSDRTWHRVPVSTGRLGLVRGFGSFLAIVDYQPKSEKMPDSAGREEWRTEDTAAGPNMAERFDEDDLGYAYPGRLSLYDAATERMYTILTNQGDSEILLVEDGVVYYRASDRLYSVPITPTGLGQAKLLTASEVVRDAHWAFIRRPGKTTASSPAAPPLTRPSPVPAAHQLHLITGYPTEEASDGHASSVLRVETGGRVRLVAELAPEGYLKGTNWIAVSEELRKAVVIPKDRTAASLPFIVLDLNTAAVTKTCQKRQYQVGGIERWLLNLPDRGPVYMEKSMSGLTSQGTIGPAELKGIALDSGAGCEEFPVEFSGGDLQYLSISGVASGGQNDGLRVFPQPNGDLSITSPSHVSLGLQIPGAMYQEAVGGASRSGVWIAVNNSKMVALVTMAEYGPAGPDAARFEHLLVYRKGDASWHRVPQVSELTYLARGFGGYLAIPEAQMKDDKLKESAGAAEWGPEMQSRFAQSRAAFPGRLHIYDVETERTYTIETGQADSEVLLIEGGVVYYRASGRLYSAPITKTGLGGSKLLANDEAIREAHRAFFTR